MASMVSLTSGLQVSSLRAWSGEVAGDIGRDHALRSAPATASSSCSSDSGVPMLVQPLASRRCDLTGKKANNGYRVSFSHHRTKHLQGVNLQYKRLWWEEANRFVKLRLSTKALKTIEKKGLSQMAKDAGIDLLDYAV